MERKVLSAMTELGFTKSESKVYTALLKKQQRLYELAASSGVPRSAIYNILKKLESGGLINAIQDKPARCAVAPRAFRNYPKEDLILPLRSQTFSRQSRDPVGARFFGNSKTTEPF